MTWMHDSRHLRFNDDNTLELMGGRDANGKWEPTCPVCECEILWCLEMISFTTGFDKEHPFTMAHARCVWTPEAFQDEAIKAREKAIHEAKVRAGHLGGTAKRDNQRRNAASEREAADCADKQ